MKKIASYLMYLLALLVLSIPFYFLLAIFFNIINRYFDFTYPSAFVIYFFATLLSSPIVHVFLLGDIKKIVYIEKEIKLKNNKYISNRNKFFFKIVYFILGLVIVLFPPQYYKKEVYYKMYGKFAFVINSKTIDIYFIIFEILAYIFLGIIFYILFVKDKNVKQDY